MAPLAAPGYDYVRNQKLYKKKNLLISEQHCVGGTAIKVNMTNTHLHLFTAS